LLQHNGKNNNKKAYFIQFSRSGNYKRTNNVRKTWHFLCPKWPKIVGFRTAWGGDTDMVLEMKRQDMEELSQLLYLYERTYGSGAAAERSIRAVWKQL
jgi:hypothetical protein